MNDQDKPRMLSESEDSGAIDVRARVLVPYADFLARRDRRRAVAAELRRQDSAPKSEAAEPAAPATPITTTTTTTTTGPRPGDEKDRREGPAKNADRAT